MSTPDFLIIGGGVIGMMTARRLAEAGHGVTLLERGRCGQEASWAGGGIISPLYPWQQADAISRLAIASQAEYPALVATLAEQTGIDSEYRIRGLLYLDPDDTDAAQDWATRMNQRLAHVDAAFVAHQEPHLTPDIRDGLWMPALGSIRNPRLCRALRARLEQLPRATLCEHTEVQRLRLTASGVAVETANGSYTGGRTILCGGAWSAGLLGNLGIELPITPVKGQMLLFRTPRLDGNRLLNRVVLRNGRYLIPRADGRVLAGSTLEPGAGFDQRTSAATRASLRATAIALLPALADCRIERHWAGLRPGAPGGLPLIGAVPGVHGLFVNAGHYRNGLVLAPATTRLLVDQLLERHPTVDPTPFEPISRGLTAPRQAVSQA